MNSNYTQRSSPPTAARASKNRLRIFRSRKPSSSCRSYCAKNSNNSKLKILLARKIGGTIAGNLNTKWSKTLHNWCFLSWVAATKRTAKSKRASKIISDRAAKIIFFGLGLETLRWCCRGQRKLIKNCLTYKILICQKLTETACYLQTSPHKCGKLLTISMAPIRLFIRNSENSNATPSSSPKMKWIGFAIKPTIWLKYPQQTTKIGKIVTDL